MPNKSRYHSSTFIYCLLSVKMEVHFILRKTGPAKTGAAGSFPLTLSNCADIYNLVSQKYHAILHENVAQKAKANIFSSINK